MAANAANLVILHGHLAGDVVVRPNADGSSTLYGTVAATQNYKSRDGERHADFIDFQMRLNDAEKAEGLTSRLVKGQGVGISASLRTFQKEEDYVRNGQIATGKVTKTVVEAEDISLFGKAPANK